jgi:hypothetical protein
MVMLAFNQPFRSREPRILVENKLAVGTHRFRLTVIDNDKNESAPTEIVVTIRKTGLFDRFDTILSDTVRDIRTVVRDVERPVRPIRRPPNG